MLARTVVVESPAFLHVEDGQLVVALRAAEEAAGGRREAAPALRQPAKGSAHPRVPLEDLGILVLDGPGIALTKEVLAECAARNVAVVVCGPKRLPEAQLVPYAGHTLCAKVFREQLAASLPLKKQVWRRVVQAKLRAQASALRSAAVARGRTQAAPARRLETMAKAVRSGDPDNLEAQAASVYFEALFGPDFVRDRELPGLNSMLNYAYAVVRAATARAIVGTGLHPGIGVHHDNQYNPMPLVDDAVEPLRPLADLHVLAVQAAFPDADDLSPPVKRALLRVLESRMVFAGAALPLDTCLSRYAASLKRALCGEGRKVECPSLEEEG